MSTRTGVSQDAQRKPRGGPFGLVLQYFRQVIDELRKVVWPTRAELRTYFIVVIVFILAIMLFTGVLDFVFDRVVMWVFG